MTAEKVMTSGTGGGKSAAFASVTTLFFAWGFITVTVDPLIAALKTIFSLSYAEVMLTQFAFFMAYGLVSLPAAGLIARLGYVRSIVGALAIMAVGCLCVPLTEKFNTFEVVLGALFIIASGITILQVAANPLAASLDDPARSHLRLTLAQAFNSLGTFLAPYLASSVILSGALFSSGGGSLVTEAQRTQSLHHISLAFMGVAGLIVCLALFIWAVRRQFQGIHFVSESGAAAGVAGALRSRWALLGAAAIFLYVGAEVSIGSAMTNLLHQSDVLGVTLQEGGQRVSLYWGGAMIGRFVGSALMVRFRAAVLLACAAAVAAALCLTVGEAPGALAGWAALSIGLFNSIMFPVIFTLTLERSSASSAATSSLLCVAITGGAVLPLLFGRIADLSGIRSAYVVPLVAYACISAFGLMAARTPARELKQPQLSH
ncbi:MAG TPA: glucose/galactose MFS transporter [Steroidobacteraceae bacterium]|nr:glucose/galactose MFS transporter [Steroidobacteraceae bacterium]